MADISLMVIMNVYQFVRKILFGKMVNVSVFLNIHYMEVHVDNAHQIQLPMQIKQPVFATKMTKSIMKIPMNVYLVLPNQTQMQIGLDVIVLLSMLKLMEYVFQVVLLTRFTVRLMPNVNVTLVM